MGYFVVVPFILFYFIIICCGVGGFDGVSGSTMVDGFDFLCFVRWWMENN